MAEEKWVEKKKKEEEETKKEDEEKKKKEEKEKSVESITPHLTFTLHTYKRVLYKSFLCVFVVSRQGKVVTTRRRPCGPATRRTNFRNVSRGQRCVRSYAPSCWHYKAYSKFYLFSLATNSILDRPSMNALDMVY
jgi:hypothetical protein